MQDKVALLLLATGFVSGIVIFFHFHISSSQFYQRSRNYMSTEVRHDILLLDPSIKSYYSHMGMFYVGKGDNDKIVITHITMGN